MITIKTSSLFQSLQLLSGFTVSLDISIFACMKLDIVSNRGDMINIDMKNWYCYILLLYFLIFDPNINRRPHLLNLNLNR